MKSTTQSKCFYSIKAAAAACWINWKSAIRRRLPTLAACLLFVRLPTPSAFDYGRDQRVGGGMDRTSTLCALIGYISAGSTVVKWCVPVAVQHVTCASSSIDSDEVRTRADGHRRHQFIIISRWFSYRQSRWPATVLLKPMKLLVEKDWTGGGGKPVRCIQMYWDTDDEGGEAEKDRKPKFRITTIAAGRTCELEINILYA